MLFSGRASSLNNKLQFHNNIKSYITEMSKSPKSSIIKHYHFNVFSSCLYEFLIACIQFKYTHHALPPTYNMHADWRLFFFSKSASCFTDRTSIGLPADTWVVIHFYLF